MRGSLFLRVFIKQSRAMQSKWQLSWHRIPTVYSIGYQPSFAITASIDDQKSNKSINKIRPNIIQMLCYCHAKLNSRIKCDLSTAVAQHMKPLSSTDWIKFGNYIYLGWEALPCRMTVASLGYIQTVCSCHAKLNIFSLLYQLPLLSSI